MISWRIIAPILTALGAVPLILFAYYLPDPTSPLTILGYMYVSIVIAFIAGIDWIIAIEEQKGWFLVWSIVLSLLPLLILAQHIYFNTNCVILWSQYLLLIWISLFIDRKLFNSIGIAHYLQFRLTGTIILSIAILYSMIQFT